MIVLLLGIAHFCDVPGGGPRMVLDEALELARRGDEVWVLAPGRADQPEHEIRDGIHLLRYVPQKAASWNPRRRFAHQIAVRAVLKKHLPRVDAIHGHAPLPYLAALDLYGDSVHASYDVHSPARMEMAIVWRNAGFLRRVTAPFGLNLINRIERECLRRSRAASAESQYTIDCIRKIHGRRLASSIQLLPGWVDCDRYVPVNDRRQAKRQLGWPADEPVLFTLRRLAPRMGLDRLLQACRMLMTERLPFHLIIGGSGPLRRSLEEQTRNLGLSDRVTFLGRIGDDQLPLAYAACDAFVLPTAELECFGLIAIEALSAGRPVLATPVGAIPEILQKVEPSWLSRTAAIEDIAALLRDFLTGSLPEHSPDALHSFMRGRYSRDLSVPKFLKATLEHSGGL